MSFFIRKTGHGGDATRKKLGGSKLKKKGSAKQTPESTRSIRKPKLLGSEDEEIPSDIESEEENYKRKQADLSSSDEEEETAQEKRLRLAKKYLANLEDADEDDLTVADRLKQDVLEQSGKLHKAVATTYQQTSDDDVRVCRGHKLPLTCVVITPDNKHVFTGSKDCTIIKWQLEDGKKVKVIPRAPKGSDGKTGHIAHVLCLAVSSDNSLLASGDRSKTILLWKPESCELVHAFTGHRDAITGLVFRRGSHQLYSASMDRSVKLWNADEMAYVETLFGHHDIVTAIDSLSRERAVTAGGRDGSVRIWKIIEESQLVFNGHSGSIDCVALIDEEHFVSGADDNSIALWSVMKKKPLVTVTNAHKSPESITTQPSENWISAVCSLTNTDLIATGSKNGLIQLWQCANGFKRLNPLFSIKIKGFINGLKFSSNGEYLVAAVGQEHRLGRWWSLKESKNSLCIIPLKKLE